jgi:hypothetical protein
LYRLNRSHGFSLFFLPTKIRVSSTDVLSSLFLPQCRLSSGRHHHVTAPCHASFPLSKDELIASTSSSGKFRPVASHLKPKLKHWIHTAARLPLNRPTSILHCYESAISTVIILLITQPRLYFTSSLVTTSRHQSSTRHRRFLSLSSHAYHPSVRWHIWWWTSWLFFTFQITYRYVNSRKKYFKILQHHTVL